MRFLANENFPVPSILRLRHAGYDVASVIEDSPGASDPDVQAQAAREERIILTFDRDYGELVFRRKLPAPAGVLFFRFNPASPEEPADLLLQVLAEPEIELSGKFTVVERDRLRQRQLPER